MLPPRCGPSYLTPIALRRKRLLNALTGCPGCKQTTPQGSSALCDLAMLPPEGLRGAGKPQAGPLRPWLRSPGTAPLPATHDCVMSETYTSSALSASYMAMGFKKGRFGGHQNSVGVHVHQSLLNWFQLLKFMAISVPHLTWTVIVTECPENKAQKHVPKSHLHASS